MTNLTNSIHYLTLYDKKEMEEILRLENEQRKRENLPILTMEELQKREVIISKKENIIDGYSITNLTINSNGDISVLVERLYEKNRGDKALNNQLFESAIFVAVEKVQLVKNEKNEIPKIISSSVIINGVTVPFNITEEYIKRNLASKFNKDAVKQKVEHDEQYKKEREKVEEKIRANTFYNETGHRFHSNIDNTTGELSVVENDFDVLTLDERLQVIQQENIGQNVSLDEAYQKFEKEKISVNMEQADQFTQDDINQLSQDSRDIITGASIIDNKEGLKIDAENNIVFDKDNKRIDTSSKKEESEDLGDQIVALVSIGYSRLAIDRVLNRDNPTWRQLSFEDKERIYKLYGVDNPHEAKQAAKERNVDVNNVELEPPVKKLVLENKEAAFVSYVIISFISGLASGLFITLLITFLNK